MNIKMDDIIAFVRVAEVGGFVAAAEELHITPSALSRRLKKLEDELGATLLDRTTRSVAVSTIGREFLPEAIRMVDDFNRSLKNVSDLVLVRKGSINVACNNTLSDTLLPEILAIYRHENPDIRIKVNEGSSPDALEWVLRGEAELALAQLGQWHPDLDFEPLIEDRFVAICRNDHPLAKEQAVTWADLKKENYVHLRRGSGTKALLERSLGVGFAELTGDIEVGHSAALLRVIGKGLGIAAIPTLVWYKRTDLELVALPVTEPIVSRNLGIVTRRGRSLSPAAERFKQCSYQIMKESFTLTSEIN